MYYVTANETKYKIRLKNAKLFNPFFFRKKFISKDMKAINYKEKVEYVLPFFHKKPLRPAFIQNMS